jgi:malate dehydrogenase (oxaloacetate-decarboxylating)
MLDSGAKDITQEVMVAAATAIADAVTPEEINASYIVPSVFDPVVAPAVAHAVRAAVEPEGGAVPGRRTSPVGKVL